ncbi:capsule biosynthesis protein [Pseudotabrizicola sp. L79]|uniref:capsule biosynthesis protein n=1 Tax=Pseudotabrizicola sp. L79 TaxID=3118402 RepID=UPI002F95DE63
MKLKVKRYNLRRDESAEAAAPTAPARPRSAAASLRAPAAALQQDDGLGATPYPTAAAANSTQMADKAADPAAGELDQIRREGLTGRQLRMARRMAQKHGLPATSDFDAVRLLRARGLDPFQKSSIMELITAEGELLNEGGGDEPPGSRELTVATPRDPKLPQTVKPAKVPSTETRGDVNPLSDLMQIQRDIGRRRRRRSALLMARLFFFVFLPGLLAGWYYYVVATPLYATKTEFVIQQASPAGAGAGGLGGLLSGTQFATSQDSIAVQGYLQSRDAMLRLDKDMGFRAHFSADTVDPIQRLDPAATLEAAYKVYTRNVRIAYDPTEGIIKMEVRAADPQLSAAFSEALISYAEEQVDHLTQRLREDQMKGARESYEMAEAAMLAAQRRVVELQEQFKVLSSEVEVSLITSQIGQLETQLSQDRLSLAQMESNAQPNQARMDPLKRRIATLETEIATLRSRLTEGQDGGQSLAQVQSELLVAQADVQTRQLLLAQSLQAMETSRTEANRQVRYLSISVSPIPPDEAAYPRAFENTMVALLIFAGIYLMISMTAAILREQVSA